MRAKTLNEIKGIGWSGIDVESAPIIGKIITVPLDLGEWQIPSETLKTFANKMPDHRYLTFVKLAGGTMEEYFLIEGIIRSWREKEIQTIRAQIAETLAQQNPQLKTKYKYSFLIDTK